MKNINRWRKFSDFLLVLCGVFAFTSVTHAQSIYVESPQLAMRVAAGELPPVDERLPVAPLVIQPFEQIGQYGGEWRMGMVGTFDYEMLLRTIGYENLVRWNAEWTQIEPNLAQSFTANDAATVFRFTLRRGLRWSDGEPFTTEDIRFWYEDVLLNEALTESPPRWLTAGGEVVALEIIDDVSFVFRFAAPNGLFLQSLASPGGAEPTSYPRHHLERFHINYNLTAPERVWVQRFEAYFGDTGDPAHSSRWRNVGIPTMNAWVLSEPYLFDSSRIAAERNPYYWKVDTNLNQLPYIDRVSFRIFTTTEALHAVALRGEIDMQVRHMQDLAEEVALGMTENVPFQTFPLLPDQSNVFGIAFNLTHFNDTRRALYSDRNFRVALSQAIDRQAIVDAVFNGNAVPHQVAPIPISIYYNETLATQYLDYTPLRTVTVLRDLGLTIPDGEQWRTLPNGDPFMMTFDVLNEGSLPTIAEMIAQDWREVGLNVQVRALPRQSFDQRIDLNVHDVVFTEGIGGLDVLLDPHNYVPIDPDAAYGVPWGLWFSEPDALIAEEPPRTVRTQLEVYDSIRETSDPALQRSLMDRVLAMSILQFYTIGIARDTASYGLRMPYMRNVPPVMPDAFTYPTPAPTNPAQYFIDSSLRDAFAGGGS